jgi:hypothetical protein
MYTCKDIHEKILSEENLGPVGWVKFKIHMFICSSCKVTVAQMSNLQNSISTVLKKKASVSDESADNLKDELKKKFNNSSHKK